MGAIVSPVALAIEAYSLVTGEIIGKFVKAGTVARNPPEIVQTNQYLKESLLETEQGN
jgi:hypothetical protein